MMLGVIVTLGFGTLFGVLLYGLLELFEFRDWWREVLRVRALCAWCGEREATVTARFSDDMSRSDDVCKTCCGLPL